MTRGEARLFCLCCGTLALGLAIMEAVSPRPHYGFMTLYLGTVVVYGILVSILGPKDRPPGRPERL